MKITTNYMTGLQYGFGQVDYTRSEADGVMVEVIKRQENVGNFVLTVTPLSYSQFETMSLILPPELPVSTRPDEAECKHNDKIMFPLTVL